jgi:probable phosphoglycerate mutase
MDRVGASEVSDTLKLYLIRHGETAWSLTGQHTSRTDIALTQRGGQQAGELAPWLRRITFARVLTSPALRAKQTCELAAVGCEAEIEPELSEWDYGDYEGKRTSDIRQERPHWNIWRDGCPHGETSANVCDRADRLLARLRILRGNIALFSHGQFGCALGARWVEIPLSAGQHFVLRPASLCVLTHEPTHPRVPVIALWNATPGFL